MILKGGNCSISGGKYEREIATVCRKLISPHTKSPLCTQTDDELGGSGADIDIKLNWKNPMDIGIEVKRPTPDWMQMSLKKDSNGSWIGSKKAKIPKNAQHIFEEIIGSTELYQGKTPPFLLKKIKYSDWVAIKTASPEFKDDVYIPCQPNTIAQLYKEKGCQYIQISGKGLYHTGEDICGFDVPFFTCEQRIRIRIKVHHESDKYGYASLSITAAAQPKTLNSIAVSPYSLDASNKLPLLLR
jgi:hypothetical protein